MCKIRFSYQENKVYTALKRRLCFYRCLSVHGGGAWHGRGHVWQEVCGDACEQGCIRGRGGMHGCRGAFVVMVGGMCSRGCILVRCNFKMIYLCENSFYHAMETDTVIAHSAIQSPTPH